MPGLNMKSDEKLCRLLEALPDLTIDDVNALYDLYVKLTGPATETTWSNPNVESPHLPRLSNERITEMTNWDHLQDCSGGRLREIIFELPTECQKRKT
jgi:hypothetical protein